MVQAALLGPGINASTAVTELAGGDCGLQFEATSPVLQTAGAWQLQLFLAEAQVQGSPFNFSVLPAPVDVAASYAVDAHGSQLSACPNPFDCPAYFEASPSALSTHQASSRPNT